jgi:hypothetical protein
MNDHPTRRIGACTDVVDVVMFVVDVVVDVD